MTIDIYLNNQNKKVLFQKLKHKFWYDHWIEGLLLINKIIPNTSHNTENVQKASDFVTIPKHWNTKSTVFISPKGDL